MDSFNNRLDYENEKARKVYDEGVRKIHSLDSDKLYDWLKTVFVYGFDPYFEDEFSDERPSTVFEDVVKAVKDSSLDSSSKDLLVTSLNNKVRSFYDEYAQLSSPNKYVLRELQLTIEKLI